MPGFLPPSGQPVHPPPTAPMPVTRSTGVTYTSRNTGSAGRVLRTLLVALLLVLTPLVTGILGYYVATGELPPPLSQ